MLSTRVRLPPAGCERKEKASLTREKHRDDGGIGIADLESRICLFGEVEKQSELRGIEGCGRLRRRLTVVCGLQVTVIAILAASTAVGRQAFMATTDNPPSTIPNLETDGVSPASLFSDSGGSTHRGLSADLRAQ